MRIAYLTAGAAGMFCGSCMHDNALARTLQKRGVDCLLLPIYTPIRTDEQDVSADQLFFGGINVYLQQKMPWTRFVPGPVRRVLDSPRLLRWAAGRVTSTDAALLGDLTVSMLRGRAGRQRSEVDRLVQWLAEHMRPDCVILSNFLIGGCIPALRERLHSRICVTLQGDDIFLDHLPPASRDQVIELLSDLVGHVDAFLVNSTFYGDKMAAILKIPPHKIHHLPLAIDTTPFLQLAAPPLPVERDEGVLRIGYLARLAPEKGLHHLVEAFVDLSRRPQSQRSELHVAGWLGEQHREYVAALADQIRRAGLADRYRYHGSPDLAGKLKFLQNIDVLSVPTTYEEPKGLFVLEAMAAGVPVVQPAHGAFPEMITATGGGWLFPPGNPAALADRLHACVTDPHTRRQLGQTGKLAVLQQRTLEQQADQLLAIVAALEQPAHQ